MAAPSIALQDVSDPFAWNKLSGDFILRARADLHRFTIEPTCKLGWRVRSALEPDSVAVEAFVQGDGLTALQRLRAKGAGVEQVVLSIKRGDVLQLERRGKACIFSAAHNGEPFAPAATAEIDLGDDVEACLFFISNNPAVHASEIFRDVRITRPVKPDFRPYHDFIGARLEILEVFTGNLKVVHRSAEQFEAPNGMPDGRTLIVNVSGLGPNKGRLRTFDLETGSLATLETGFGVRNNNDHVLSFDGQQLGISHHSADDDGWSVIYTLPATGGTPKRVTANAPSYLHSWSPDAEWLVYTGGRKPSPTEPEKYDIYKIRASGGDEIRLTSSPGLSDGPEFTPDGRHIYFNSTRSGLMQLWRMKPDGTEQEQVTNDEFNNWFPHISPDGKWIAFLSFNQDVRPEDHPYYRHVYVRLMPIAGGTPKVIAYVYGGQGTINVPSWSPDSKRIAFVSNTDGL